MTRVVTSAAALLIGSELLSGKVREANLFELAKTLRSAGIELGRVVVVPDRLELIVSELHELSARYDVVFTSGGVGPTHDDVTIDAVAAAFSKPVVVEPHLEAMLKKAYGAACTESHLRMARVPLGASLINSTDINWPIVVMRNVWLLPGVPEIFRMKLSIVREQLRGPLPFVSRAAFMQLEEAALKPLIDQAVAAHPRVEIGSYPIWFNSTYKTKVTFDAREPALADAALGMFVALLPPGEPQRTE